MHDAIKALSDAAGKVGSCTVIMRWQGSERLVPIELPCVARNQSHYRGNLHFFLISADRKCRRKSKRLYGEYPGVDPGLIIAIPSK